MHHCLLLFIYFMVHIWHRYSEDSNNCFDFVLRFLQLFLRTFITEIQGASQIVAWDTITNKERFCSAWVLPQTRRADRYISIYRQLLCDGFVIDTSGSCVQTDTSQPLINVESCMTRLWMFRSTSISLLFFTLWFCFSCTFNSLLVVVILTDSHNTHDLRL